MENENNTVEEVIEEGTQEEPTKPSYEEIQAELEAIKSKKVQEKEIDTEKRDKAIAERRQKKTQKEMLAQMEDKFIRSEMKAGGITDKDLQNEIKDFMEYKGIDDVDEALSNSVVKTLINEFTETQKAQKAVSRPNGKPTSNSNDIDGYISRGEIPEDKDLASKVRDELSRRASQNY